MKLTFNLVISIIALSLVACGDDITNNVPAASNETPSEKVEAQAQETYSLKLNKDIVLPVLSSGFKITSDIGECSFTHRLSLSEQKLPKGLELKMLMRSLDLQGAHDENLKIKFHDLNQLAGNIGAECTFGTQLIEEQGLQTALDSFSSDEVSVSLNLRRQVQKLVSKIVFGSIDESKVELPKLVRSIELKASNIGECTLGFHNVGEKQPTLATELEVYSDKLKLRNASYPRREYYEYTAEFKDEFVSKLECELNMENADQVKAKIQEFFSGDKVEVTKIDYYL